jgi:hypothetical protein
MCCEYGWWRHCICIWEKEERGGEEGEGNVRRSSLEDEMVRPTKFSWERQRWAIVQKRREVSCT